MLFYINNKKEKKILRVGREKLSKACFRTCQAKQSLLKQSTQYTKQILVLLSENHRQ